jgi:hypothetical protein
VNRDLSEGISGCFGVVPEAEDGVGGAAGMKKEGIAAIEDYIRSVIEGRIRNDRQRTIIAIYSTMLGISLGPLSQNGSINCARAPPNGLAKLIIAVAATLPLFVNHKSEYLVGAERTNGCANPTKI